MKLFRNLICLTLVVAFATGAAMADEEKKGKGKKKRDRKAPSATQRLLTRIELTDEQKEQVKAIDAQFAEKLAELNKKRNGILTEEQSAARKAAQAQAKKDGLKGADMQKAIAAVLNLTDEQQEQQKALRKPQQELNAEIVAALKKILTEEQVAKLPRQGRTGKGGGKDRKKKEKDAA